MKKEGKKWMLVAIALLAVVTVTLPLVGCKNDSVSEPAIYTVTFNSNGGTGTMNPQSFTAGEEQELTENAFTRENYTFVGWSEDSEATSATYGDKAKFTATKDTTLYAVWNPRWLTFTSDSSTALITKYYVNDGLDSNGKAEVPTGMEYSTDGKTWTAFTNPQQDIPFGNGTELYLRGRSSTGTAQDALNYVNFTFKENTKVSASGDIHTLVDWNDPVNAVTSNARFSRLFEYCDELVTAPKLPATTLATDCYFSMFEDCTSLTTAPELPATNLVNCCYQRMFNGCTSLTTAPELKAERLAAFCYESMFFGCTSLETAPELKAETLADLCYANMFFNCTSLTTAPELKAERLADLCYESMFFGCTSLETAPELKAETLADLCYANMFFNCTELASVTMLATDVSAVSALDSWLDGTADKGTLTVASGMESDETINNNKPAGWTVKDKTN